MTNGSSGTSFDPSAFDPSGVAVKNGRFFGFPYSADEAEIVILPAPWDVTTSYRDGTHRGPEAILAASPQLDFTSPYRARAWETKIGSEVTPAHWEPLNKSLRLCAKAVIEALESGAPAPEKALREVNNGGLAFHAELQAMAKHWINKGKKVVTVGGDHSVSYGPIRAHGEKYPELSVLHIDAHADLRVAYEGFEHSHASIMNHVAQMPFVKALVQVGMRDVSPVEMEYAEREEKIHSFYEWELKRAVARGISWEKKCAEIIAPLGKDVYLSLDVDGLDPKYCPGTGTPVPGGLELWELLFLLEEVEKSGRRFVGADLVEVSPVEGSEWDANVGARLLFQICQFLR